MGTRLIAQLLKQTSERQTQVTRMYRRAPTSSAPLIQSILGVQDANS
jgi:hypothetical protein